MAARSNISPGARLAVKAKMFSHVFEALFEVETLKAIAVPFVIRLIVSLLLATKGFGMDARFF